MRLHLDLNVNGIRLLECQPVALLPLLWADLLAQHLGLGMAEAGLVLPVSLAPWWHETAASLPAWSADPQVIGFCQSLVLLVGVGG